LEDGFVRGGRIVSLKVEPPSKPDAAEPSFEVLDHGMKLGRDISVECLGVIAVGSNVDLRIDPRTACSSTQSL
jgi:hypothetical protein